jgi:hypothetical protein
VKRVGREKSLDVKSSRFREEPYEWNTTKDVKQRKCLIAGFLIKAEMLIKGCKSLYLANLLIFSF